MATLEQARAAKRRLRETLVGTDGVCGLGLAPADRPDQVAPEEDALTTAGAHDDTATWCVLVNVTTAEVSARVPSEVDGVPVRVRVTGTIRAL